MSWRASGQPELLLYSRGVTGIRGLKTIFVSVSSVYFPICRAGFCWWGRWFWEEVTDVKTSGLGEQLEWAEDSCWDVYYCWRICEGNWDHRRERMGRHVCISLLVIINVIVIIFIYDLQHYAASPVTNSCCSAQLWTTLTASVNIRLCNWRRYSAAQCACSTLATQLFHSIQSINQSISQSISGLFYR